MNTVQILTKIYNALIDTNGNSNLTNGTQKTQIIGSPIVLSHSGSTTETITVTGTSITITNDGATDLTVTVNGIRFLQ